MYLPTVGRNTLRLPDTGRVDLRVSRAVHVTERVRMRGSAEIFNLTNRVNYSAIMQRAFLVGTETNGVTPLIFQDAATVAAEGLNVRPFGTFTAASTGQSPERQVQLGVRVEFLIAGFSAARWRGCCRRGRGTMRPWRLPGRSRLHRGFARSRGSGVNCTPLPVISATVLWMSLTCQPRMVKGKGVKSLYADDADHGSVGVHDDGEGVVADEAQAEEFFVEAPRSGRVFGGDEGDERAVSKHGWWPR